MRGAPRDFDAEAAEWDSVPARLRVAGAVAECLIQRLALGPTTRVLDYGCGTGLVTLPLAARAGSVVAADPSAPMLAVLQRKLRERRAGNVRAVRANLERGDLVGHGFDLAVCTQTLTHVQDAGRALSLLREVLAPGGTLAVSEMDLASPTSGGFDRRELRALVSAAGFLVEGIWDALEVADVPPTPKRYYVLLARKPVAPAMAPPARSAGSRP